MSLDLHPHDDPISALRRWYREAVDQLPRDEAHRVALATCTIDAVPSNRIVLCREIDEEGQLYFYTNYRSRKARELDDNPRAAGVFHWPALQRQMRAQGTVKRAPLEVSDAYWASRPVDSRISAAASPQSQPIAGPDELVRRCEEVRAEFEGQSIPRPENWGGYVLRPLVLEFWHEGSARLHERIRFERKEGFWRGEFVGP